MSPIQPVLDRLGGKIATLSAELGRRVDVASMGILDRLGHLPLADPGRTSCNGACRLAAASDGWIAVNLARDEDRELVPAWLEAGIGEDPWTQIERLAPTMTCASLVERAALMGLPAGAVGEVWAPHSDAVVHRMGVGTNHVAWPPQVLDLSALWAGPLCGAVLAAAGARVTRVESLGRPDPTRTSTPELFRRLNGTKAEVGLDLRGAADRRRLVDLASEADILITGARPAALARLGVTPEALFTANPNLIWVAITGYGWSLATADRVAFGDDASAAGGLVGWTAAGEPRFLGDALADPITGLAAAAAALTGFHTGGGVVVDAALAVCAAGAASELGLRRAA